MQSVVLLHCTVMTRDSSSLLSDACGRRTIVSIAPATSRRLPIVATPRALSKRISADAGSVAQHRAPHDFGVLTLAVIVAALVPIRWLTEMRASASPLDDSQAALTTPEMLQQLMFVGPFLSKPWFNTQRWSRAEPSVTTGGRQSRPCTRNSDSWARVARALTSRLSVSACCELLSHGPSPLSNHPIALP